MTGTRRNGSPESTEAAKSAAVANLGLSALDQAKEGLAKLPILGPALWLYARDPVRKYMFVADIDWALLPAIVLDQCRLYTKGGLPYAFVTWALVSDAVEARLRSSEPKIAPHEWQSGPHLWVIDAVAPFGAVKDTLDELRQTLFPCRSMKALLPVPGGPGRFQLHEWPDIGTTAPARAG